MSMLIRLLIAVVLLAFAPRAMAQSVIPPGTTWYWQLDGKVNTTHTEAKVYDIDAANATPALVKQLQTAGHTVIGYFSAGTWEPGRSDSAQFPQSAIGKKLSGWSDVYVDFRDPTVRKIMQARMDMVKAKGFSGFEPDVLDAFENRSGFPITKQDEIDYIKWLGNEGHARGLIVALKNDPEIVNDVVTSVDFAIAEQCLQYNECPSYSPFITHGKAVLSAEYQTFSAAKCAKAKALGLSTVYFNLDLNGKKYQPCP